MSEQVKEPVYPDLPPGFYYLMQRMDGIEKTLRQEINLVKQKVVR